MLLRGLECDSFASHGDNVRSYIQLVLQRLYRETGLQVLQLCQQFSWKHLHSVSEWWLIATWRYDFHRCCLLGARGGGDVGTSPRLAFAAERCSRHGGLVAPGLTRDREGGGWEAWGF